VNKTQIEWVKNPDGTPGYTWNPITGCLNNCPYCYARRLANGRLRERYLANKNVPDNMLPEHWEAGHTDPFYPRFWEDKIIDAVRSNISKRKARGIFTCDMSDLFGIGIPEEWTRRVIEVCKGNWRDRFYLLTKQPQNLIKFSPFPDNCWVGVTATDHFMYKKALPILGEIQAKVKYISFEPLLHHVDIEAEPFQDYQLDWLIIGAQTKPTVYPDIEWVQEITEACDKAGVKVFHKDNLKSIFPTPTNTLRQELPNA